MSTKEQPISNLGLSGFIAQRVQRKDGSYRCTLRCKPKGSDKFIPAGKIDEGEFGVVIFREEFIARFPQLKDVIVIRKPDRNYVYCSAAEPASVAETCAPAPAPQAQPKPQSAAPTLQPGERPIAELNLPGFIAQRNKRADGTYRCSLRYKLKGTTKCPSVGKVAGNDEFGPIIFNDSFVALYPKLKELTVLRTSDRGYVYLEGALKLPEDTAKAPAAKPATKKAPTKSSGAKSAAAKSTAQKSAATKTDVAATEAPAAATKAAKSSADQAVAAKTTATKTDASAAEDSKTAATKPAAAKTSVPKTDASAAKDSKTVAAQPAAAKTSAAKASAKTASAQNAEAKPAATKPAATKPAATATKPAATETAAAPKAQPQNTKAQVKSVAGTLTMETLRAQTSSNLNGGLYGNDAASQNLPGFWVNCPGEPSEADVKAIFGRSTAELGQLLAQFSPEQTEQFFLEQIKSKQHDPKRRLFLLKLDLNNLPQAQGSSGARSEQAAQPYLFLAEDQWAAPCYVGAPQSNVSSIEGLCDEAERLSDLVQATRGTPEPDDSDEQRAIRPVLLLGPKFSGKSALTYCADANFDLITQLDSKSAVGASALDMAARFNIVSAQNRIATNPQWHHLALPPATDLELEGEDDTILVHLHVLLNNQGYEATIKRYTQMAQRFIKHKRAGSTPDVNDLQCLKLKLVTASGEQKSYKLNTKNIEQQALAPNLVVLGTTIANLTGGELVRGAQMLTHYPQSLSDFAQRAELKFTGDQGSRLLLAWALNYIFSNEVRALHQ